MVFAVLWVLPLIHPDITKATWEEDLWRMALGAIVMFGPPVLFLAIGRAYGWIGGGGERHTVD